MIDYVLFNSNLSATENIISSKYNFKFPDLGVDDVSPTDIMVSVLQARVIAEGICRYIVLQERLVKDEKNIRTATLKVYIDDIIRPSLIVPKTIVSHLTTIQGISNLAVHYQIEGRLSIKECYIALESLEQVVEWFVITYEKDNKGNHKWKISTDSLNSSGAIPPKTEGCIISRIQDVENIRRIVVLNKTILLCGNTGVGKTELVKDYINKYKRKYDGIYYCENVDDIDSFIYNLPIGIMNEESKAKNEIINEKLSVLHSMETPYLFVVDNFIGNFDALEKLFPTESDTYHLIVVVIDEFGTHNELENYNVEPFSLEDSRKIFKYFCDINYDDTLITELLNYLSLNPRAIRMSAAFLRDNEKFTISMLLDSIKRNSSIQNIISNLYLIMTDISIIESNANAKIVSGLLSLLPYTGVSLERVKSLLLQPEEKNFDEHAVDDVILQLQKSGWIAIDNMGSISMNPLLSDTIYERIHPSLTDPYVVAFIVPILKPIKDIRDLYIQQIVALEPFVDHLTKRIDAADSCDLDILNYVREFYIAVFNIEKVEHLSDLMEIEFRKVGQKTVDAMEMALYRQGISRFNLEDFNSSHSCFQRAISSLDKKIVEIEKHIAMMCAYEGASLAAIGYDQEAVDCVERSISLREKLANCGYSKERANLWISHYNYAKVLLMLSDFKKAEYECDTAIGIYAEEYHSNYIERNSTNVSSLLQLKGRILAGQHRREEAITLLEEAKSIREKLKGKNYFSTAQVYSYLMSTYEQFNMIEEALNYARLFYDVLSTQYKTDDIVLKIENVKAKIEQYERALCHA